jgi:hypothetical protein
MLAPRGIGKSAVVFAAVEALFGDGEDDFTVATIAAEASA